MKNNNLWGWCPVCHKQLGKIGEVCPTCSNIFIPSHPVELTKGGVLGFMVILVFTVFLVAITATVMAL